MARVRALEQRRDSGAAVATGRITVAMWLDHWLDTIAAPKVKPSTLAAYRGYVGNRITPAIGHHRLDRLQPEHVEAMYAALKADGMASASVLQVHRILSRALKVAMQRGKVARNVATLVDPPSLQSSEVVPLSRAEARAVLAAAEGTRNAARWSVALALGLRQGEALGLPWDAVDLDAATLIVRQALQRQAGRGLVITPYVKSLAGRRTIYLPPALTAALRAHRRAQSAERLAAGSLWEDTGLVFTQANGKPTDPGGDYKAWKRLLTKAGVRDARLHDARHTAATLLLLQGVPARAVMALLGHSTVSLTLNTYSHVVPEIARETADRMEDALWG